MQIEVTQDFLDHRAVKYDQYNQRGRSEHKFLMDLDAELLEHYMISEGYWNDHNDWKVGCSHYEREHRRQVPRSQQQQLHMQQPQAPTTCCSSETSLMDISLCAGDRDQTDLWKSETSSPFEPAGFAEYDRVADGMRANKDGNGTYYFHTRMVLAADRDVSDLFHQVPTYRV